MAWGTPEREQKVFQLWVLVERADGIQGLWMAFVPELCWATYGHSVAEAIDLAKDGATEIIVHGLNQRLDPLRGPVDEEAMARVEEIRAQKNQVRVDTLDEQAEAGKFSSFLVRRSIVVERKPERKGEATAGSAPNPSTQEDRAMAA